MRKILKILFPWKVIALFTLLFFFSLSQIYADVITLQWDPNTEPDLDHYVVYWGIDFDPPYGYKSENIDKSQTTYTVTGLSEGRTYYFAAKAVDTQGLKSDYSNIVSTDNPYGVVTEEGAPQSVSEAGGGGCFIATAAYGSNMDKHVKILTKFRDKHLVTNPVGRGIVKSYYKLSPPFADYVRNYPVARAIVRYSLIPITGIAYLSLSIHPLALLFAFFFMLLTGIYCARRLSRPRNNSIL